jgi:DNA polymerase-4
MFRALDEGWKSKTAAIKLRFHDFTTLSAQKTLKHWIASAEELHAMAIELFQSRWTGGTPVRLIGVGLSNLVAMDAQDQLELFTDDHSRQKKVEEAVFRLQRKLGEGTLTKASLMHGDGRRKPPTNP